tara:strand:- start:223 stop:495 length:273 start_codon:yes stop_codon:yes gene_type:complete
MKNRILENNLFGGIYTNEFLENNKNNIVNGKIVSDWNLTEVECSLELILPIFNNGEWVESATDEEIQEHNMTMQRLEAIEKDAISDSISD